jgi:hypothetical protein
VTSIVSYNPATPSPYLLGSRDLKHHFFDDFPVEDYFYRNLFHLDILRLRIIAIF